MAPETLLVIFNLIIVESLLSVDNASALAAMVQHLPNKQRHRALRYGLLGAYTFRGICLFIASWLIKLIWLKALGGAYLLYLTYNYFKDKSSDADENKKIMKGFLATVISVEILDLSLSLDNIFAAIALSDKFWVIMTGVAIGILAMRFVAGWFVKLIDRYRSLEDSAFIVVFLLGLKLIISAISEYSIPFAWLKETMSSHSFDLYFSAIMMAIFFCPIIFKRNKKIAYGNEVN